MEARSTRRASVAAERAKKTAKPPRMTIGAKNTFFELRPRHEYLQRYLRPVFHSLVRWNVQDCTK